MPTAQLFLHRRPIESIFELLGSEENTITSCVGWALYACTPFVKRFLRETVEFQGNVDEVTIRLQHYKKMQGITDIELSKLGQFHIIVEAKKGWSVPGVRQLKKYAARLATKADGTRRILVLTQCSAKYAEDQLDSTNVGGIPVRAISWDALAQMARETLPEANYREKWLLRQIITYLRRVATVQDIEADIVYVVSLSERGILNAKRRRYSHPAGARWPKEPPNYIGFRYYGQLQSIHRVEGFEVTKGDVLSEPRFRGRTPHFLYRLGPPIAPPKEVPTGRIFRNGRVWCFWDTLFTCKTISQACDVSAKRRRTAERTGG